ncbi:hypothetical protein COW36_09300 [bacterium (Candidatus Blackallbacteria) CG17_big_fil_post_rev_8_21_14_2_50_48_46]|uniref:Uncharacterized protein n=1 Tax=bacterium (Candidatus Blackallbacteria) CG17_big_fil_post_rev_8_21_14_2_50_48_46 TaxID=2014261 RepID=A0A2M7G5U0_9BACT|nr:MAG: hypothetical protein COW64_23750 [bacterium (Candidatus Blackallbacteria) CG18_big_fil_WC_8_21_14_2_50_49_26]PIW17361.1 MAG: hypothetical protein COW36_09300 [bacterium (Candidatus Blackallbacteria) CG17_big_fil_post_rev_8_21_14_2_50_48_46]PIW47407.1 MAG: hypothetical protein COW20_12530 [bacterium (Candidatus Blackallbacteria) CG13_big_fil_rev_8_21_14_2_50_49_14]
MKNPFQRWIQAGSLALVCLLLKAQTTLPQIEKINAHLAIENEGSQMQISTWLTLSAGTLPASFRFYLPADRQIEGVYQAGTPLRFSHQGGLLIVYMNAAGTRQTSQTQLQIQALANIETGPESPYFSIQDYQLDYQTIPAQSRFQVEAHLKIQAKALAALKDSGQTALKALPLGLSSAFHVTSVKSAGSALKYQHHQGRLKIFLPRPLMPGASTSLEINYSGKLPGINKYQIWDFPFGGGGYYYPSHPLRPGAY